MQAEDGPRLGFWLGRPYAGRGLMSEAVEAVTDVFFRVTEARNSAALVLPENAASRAVLEKCGFGEAERFEAGPGAMPTAPSCGSSLRRRRMAGVRRRSSLRPALRLR